MLDFGEMHLEKLPEWLPSGWAMEVRERLSGSRDKYYIDPVYGYKFRSKRDVFRHLGVGGDVVLLPKKKNLGVGGDVVVPMKKNPSVSSLVPVTQDMSVNMRKSFDWLPKDWTVEFRERKDGLRVDKYYIDPNNRYKLRSKREVFRHLGIEDVAVGKKTTAPIAQDIYVTVEHSPKWLPSDWRVEVRERKSGSKAKCYIDTRNGHRFHSKREALVYLGIGEVAIPQKRGASNAVQIAQDISVEKPLQLLPWGGEVEVKERKNAKKDKVEELLDWLPLGWRVEIKENKTGSKYKNYIDPVSGRKFRSRREVSHYLENAEFRKPKKKRGRKKRRGAKNAESVCRDISLYTLGRTQKLGCSSTRRCLFTGQSSNTDEIKNDEWVKCCDKSALAVIPLNSVDSECRQNNMVCADNGCDQPLSLVLPEKQPVYNNVRKHGKRKSELELYNPSKRKELSLPCRTSRRLAGLPPESAPETKEHNDTLAVVAVDEHEMETGEVEYSIGIEDQSSKVGNAQDQGALEEHVKQQQVADQSNNVGKAFDVPEEPVRKELVSDKPGEVEFSIDIEDLSNKFGKVEGQGAPEEHVKQQQQQQLADQSNKVGKAFDGQGAPEEHVKQPQPQQQLADQSNKVGKAFDGLEEHVRKELASGKPDSRIFFSFGGEPLFDPCIEFAFKTLTGAIPLEDNFPTNYNPHQHVSSASTPSTSGFGLPDLNVKTLH